MPAKKKEKKATKGGSGGGGDDDFDAALEEFGAAPPAEAAAPTTKEAEPEAAAAEEEKEPDAKTLANRKKKEKKKAKQGGDDDGDEDGDDAPAEVKGSKESEPKAKESEVKAKEPGPKAKEAEPKAKEAEPKAEAETKAADAGKKKDKKKGKQAAAADDDDDFEAVLQELKGSGGAEAPEEPAASKDAKASPAAEDADEDDGDDKGDADAKTLANRKKKEKKKAKKVEPTGGEGMWGPGGGGEAAPSAAAAASSSAEKEKEDEEEQKAADSKSGKKGAKAKPQPKESAAVRAARERLELQKKLDEEKRAWEEAERKRVEEENRRIAEEEAKEAAERQRKRDARAAKIKKQKEEGTYMTKAQKAKAARAAQLREQFGFVMEKDPADDDNEEGDAEESPKKLDFKPQKRQLATKLKKKRPQDGQQEDGEQKPDDKAEDEEEKPKPKEAEAPKKEREEEEDGDDWEKVADELEQDGGAEKETAAEQSEDDDGGGSSSSSSSSSSDFPGYRSPIICIMGHVDTGKTKLLDKIRRTNVQEGEAGGITQQIGATFFPDVALQEQTKKVDPDFDIEVPGLLIIDTPGHESFNNLRARGSSLCDLAILVIDIVHGLEPQTVESLEMLRKRRCPFVIALNKIDRMYQWKDKSYTGVREALDRQEQFVLDEFKERLSNVMLQLNERGLNCALYWENEDYRSTVSIVPTSALTGEGVPDLLYMLLNLTQSLMADKLEVKEDLECTVIEVKNIEGIGTTIDVVLVNGTLKEDDTIVLSGMNGPIVTKIRALLTPQPMKEMRVKNEYIHHAKISTSMGVKIMAPGLEEAVAGTELLVLGPDDDLEDLKEEVSDGFDSILNNFEKQAEGVYVKASTLGSLEALLSFLQDMEIPVFDVGIGEVHKKDVKKAMIMKEKKHPEFAVILAFDVKVSAEAKQQADRDDVQIMTADIIYHLQDKFKAYMEKIQESRKTETRKVAVFPVVLKIDKQYIFRKTDPIILGCQVVGGQLRSGTPICVPEKDNLVIGHVGSIQRDKKDVEIARRGDTVCVKIEQNTAQQHIMYGRHFDFSNQLVSLITRASIDTLKEHFKDDMRKEDWELVISLKKLFKIE